MRGSRPYCGKRTRGFLAFLTCGWTQVIVAKTRARTGLRRLWDRAWISWSVRARLPRTGSKVVGQGVGQRRRSGRLAEAIAPKGFQVLPRRWVVERTFSWIDHNRRMSKDYERSCASGEALVYAAMRSASWRGGSPVFEDFSYSLGR